MSAGEYAATCPACGKGVAVIGGRLAQHYDRARSESYPCTGAKMRAPAQDVTVPLRFPNATITSAVDAIGTKVYRPSWADPVLGPGGEPDPSRDRILAGTDGLALDAGWWVFGGLTIIDDGPES